MSFCPSLLATATRSKELFGDLLPWLGVLAGAALVGAIIIALIRRHLRASENTQPMGFTLHELRQLRASGELTEDEFQRARAKMLGRMTGRPDNSGDDETGSDGPPDAGR